ncbi:Transposon Ty3-G Gag-Pol polyprotein [Vitis vinifera]|uniref:Transposon Ty3-G Gag-Pol polyprotein n=1 Tax=Vitis vinifera TaxID=29760 RepID=A0A438BMH9_VITVI|nr:Transposon Ty3-G Gag-Pol polyprotein [Vitis vinifera]
MKEEIQKQLNVGFISVVEYLEWLANVVLVPKKDGKVRVCVDLRDLNKASPKDDFPLSHIDMLVDNTTGHSMLSFMDGFLGYNQILMAPEDMEKTIFITEWDHLAALERFFERIWKLRLRLNPKKCTFRVTFGKLLGHMVSERGIEVDPDKIKVILDMLVPRTEKEIRGFLGRSVEKSIKGSIVADHLASLPTSEGRPVDDDFPDKEFIAMTSLSGWHMYFDGAVNQLRFGIGVLLISPQGDHISRSVHLAFSDRHPATNNIVECEACILGLEIALELGIRQMEVGRFDDLRYTCLPKAQNQFVDALTTLASSVDISTNVVIRPLLIESRFAPAYCCLIGETEAQDDLSWYYDIYQLLRSRTYPEATTAKDRRALRQLATRFMICGETLYRRSANGVCGPHMGGHMQTRKIMRTGYFWLTMETTCCQFVQRCPECQIHGDLIHASPSELHAFTSPWLFSVWGIDIIEKISPKSSNGHEFILVAIDYFTKWVEATSYARLTSARVASFIRSHIICRYGKYGIRHHRSSAFRPQTNGAVEAANKNIKKILRKMVETSQDCRDRNGFTESSSQIADL